MTWLRGELRRGVLGAGRRQAAVALVLALAVFLVSLVYDALNHGPNVLFLRTPLDQAMPLVRAFVIPYISLNPVTYVTLVIFLFFRIRVYDSAALSMITAFLVSYAFYFLVQSYVARPVVSGDDLLSQLLRGVYRGDNPYNDFPSLHVSISTILAIHWWRFDRRAGWVAAVWAIVVIASTQLVHQHYLADVGGGLVVAFAASWLWQRVLLDTPVSATAGPAAGPVARRPPG
ncbi:MAG TPA: phosphatase PAP2 family protein [Candidatus Solibacter sp.]|jgi:membrane-associated phospholipid phosphatase|nr:phosphatase PAP2 family protein [Candidatus Solibacter sp.]